MMMPTVDFCGVELSRLVLGGNMISGNSHISKEMDSIMEDYFTTQKIKDLLFSCQKAGINAMQLRGDKHIMRVIREYRLDGGNMHWIGQPAREMASFEANVNQMAGYKPSMMYLQGVSTDELFKEGNYDEIIRCLRILRTVGVPVGLCTHMPEVMEYSEAKGWDVDYYMCSVYNISVPERQVKSYAEGNEEALFVESDIPIMYEAIRSVSKPCLAFKILGASRRCQNQDQVHHAFKECFASIKKGDAVIVGMFPKDMDQVTTNVNHVLEGLLSH